MMLQGIKEPPAWLLTSMTILTRKNVETEQPRSFLPIALQNTSQKVYNEIIEEFKMDN